MGKLLDTGRPSEVECGEEVEIKCIKQANGVLLLQSMVNHSRKQTAVKSLSEGNKTSEAQLFATDVGKVLNDYIIYVVNALPQQMVSPETRQTLKRTAEQIAKQYQAPSLPVLDKPYVHFPREICIGVFDQKTGLLVPEFLDKWVDLMDLVAIKERGDFPEILFKCFRVSLKKNGNNYCIRFPDGAYAKVGAKSYSYSATIGKWVEENK